MRAAMLLALPTLLTPIASARAAITTVYVTPEYANANFGAGTLQLGIFTPTPTVTPFPAPDGSDTEQHNSIVFITRYAAPGIPTGGFTGNNLDVFPDLPLATPGLYLSGRLKIEGVTLDASGSFRLPSYNSEHGSVEPATLFHGGSFDLNDFGDGGGKAPYAYVGYCSSDKRRFGYVQYEWVSPIDWRLIGYAYGGIDEPVTVTNLVPAPGGVAVLALAAAPLLTRSRRHTENAR